MEVLEPQDFHTRNMRKRGARQSINVVQTVAAVAFSTDRKYLGTGLEINTMAVWDLEESTG